MDGFLFLHHAEIARIPLDLHLPDIIWVDAFGFSSCSMGMFQSLRL